MEENKPDKIVTKYCRKKINTCDIGHIREIKRRVPSLKNISEKDIRRVVVEFNKHIISSVVSNRDGVELPAQLGYMFVGSCDPPLRKNIDRKNTAIYNKNIEHRNWETDSYLGKIFYTTHHSKILSPDKLKGGYDFKFNEMWGFIGCRRFKQEVSKGYSANWKLYMKVDRNRKISFILRNFRISNKRMRQLGIALEHYNPFDI